MLNNKNILVQFLFCGCLLLVGCGSEKMENKLSGEEIIIDDSLPVVESAANENYNVVVYENKFFSFTHPEDWIISPTSTSDGLIELTLGERRGSNYFESFNVSYIKEKHSLDEILNSFLKPFDDRYTILTKEIQKIKFIGEECLSIDFSFYMVDEPIYSNIMVFSPGDTATVAILKQSNSQSRLTDDFKVMEGSMYFK